MTFDCKGIQDEAVCTPHAKYMYSMKGTHQRVFVQCNRPPAPQTLQKLSNWSHSVDYINKLDMT